MEKRRDENGYGQAGSVETGRAAGGIGAGRAVKQREQGREEE
jgi:hypothetical protein